MRTDWVESGAVGLASRRERRGGRGQEQRCEHWLFARDVATVREELVHGRRLRCQQIWIANNELQCGGRIEMR